MRLYFQLIWLLGLFVACAGPEEIAASVEQVDIEPEDIEVCLAQTSVPNLTKDTFEAPFFEGVFCHWDGNSFVWYFSSDGECLTTDRGEELPESTKILGREKLLELPGSCASSSVRFLKEKYSLQSEFLSGIPRSRLICVETRSQNFTRPTTSMFMHLDRIPIKHWFVFDDDEVSVLVLLENQPDVQGTSWEALVSDVFRHVDSSYAVVPCL